MPKKLYFRLQAKEQSFADLARQYSQEPESLIGGFVGPIELGNLPSALAEVLSYKPARSSLSYFSRRMQAIVRLEKVIPAQVR